MQLSFAATLFSTVSIAHAEAPPLDRTVYQRAEALLGPNLEPKVRNVVVVPHWLGDSDELWYQRSLATGTEFAVVNAASGRTRKPTDHERMAFERAVAPAPDSQGLLISPKSDRARIAQQRQRNHAVEFILTQEGEMARTQSSSLQRRSTRSRRGDTT